MLGLSEKQNRHWHIDRKHRPYKTFMSQKSSSLDATSVNNVTESLRSWADLFSVNVSFKGLVTRNQHINKNM